MQGPAHLALGWLLGQQGGLSVRRDRRIVGLAGLAPDIDILAYPLAYIAFLGDLDRAFALYARVHHRYTHGVLFMLLCVVVALCLASDMKRMQVAALTATAVAVHILADVIASGPGWPVYPLAPFSDLAWTLDWSWQVSDWRNSILSLAAIAITLWYARTRGHSMLECVSYRADDWLTAVMHGRAQSSLRFRVILYTALMIVSALVVLPLVIHFR